jgi:hypothetical protein
MQRQSIISTDIFIKSLEEKNVILYFVTYLGDYKIIVCANNMKE